MSTIVGTGASARVGAIVAAKEATRAAMSSLQGRTPSFGFVFAASKLDLKTTLQVVTDISGCASVIASSTAGEITERGLSYGGVAVMLVASDDSTCRTVMARNLADDHRGAAMEIEKALFETKGAVSKDQRRLTTVLLTDGLVGKGEDLVHELYSSVNSSGQIVGGAAGDDGAFLKTVVGSGGQTDTDAAAALHVFSAKPWGVGVAHGMTSSAKAARVTRAAGNVVYEINNLPAFELYRSHAAERGISLSRNDAGAYMIANELGIHFFERVTRVRAPLSVGFDGSLTCAAAIPEGAMISILEGDPTCMIEAAASAAEEAKKHMGSTKAAGVLLFDCVCRGMILKDAFEREVAAVRATFGDAPIAGFLTYGEIARYRGRLDGWHNATAVVVAIPH
jgi:methyl-accepting chemotaxis protein